MSSAPNPQGLIAGEREHDAAFHEKRMAYVSGRAASGRLTSRRVTPIVVTQMTDW
jgi:hypothetical protein